MTYEEFYSKIIIARDDHICRLNWNREDFGANADKVQKVISKEAKDHPPSGQSLGMGSIGRVHSRMDFQTILERAYERLKEEKVF